MTDLGRIPGQFVVPNCVEVDLLWLLSSGKAVKNVLHGSVAGGFSATAAIAQAIYAALIASGQWTAYKPYVNAGNSLAGIALRDMRTFNNPLVQSTGGSTAGTGAGLALPPDVAAVITLRTALAGRANRGRVYLPGLDSTVLNTTTGNFLAAFQTAAQNFMTEVETAMSASGITHGIMQPARAGYTGKRGAVHPARAANVQQVTSLTMRVLLPRNQRRRSTDF